MGSIIRAKCPCGFESGELYLGSGMMSSSFTAPAVCLSCELLVNHDYREKKKSKCSNCDGELLFYNSKSLRRNHEPETVKDAGDCIGLE